MHLSIPAVEPSLPPPRLPSTPLHRAPELPDLPSPLGSRPRSHILVADDDATVRGLLTLLLHRTGYQVQSVDDGEAAWAALCAQRFDLLITDNDMPRLCGLALLRRVRATFLDLPVILTSGRLPHAVPDLPRLLNPGTTLPKPFSITEVVTRVRTLLAPRRAAPLPPASTPCSAASPARFSFSDPMSRIT